MAVGSFVASLVALLVLVPVAWASTTASFAGVLVLAPSLALAPVPVVDPMVAQITPPPLPQPSAQFFYNENGKPVGPFSLAEIRAKIAAGLIKPDTLVWKAGTPNWVAAKELAEVAPFFAATPPAPAPAPKPAPAPTPVAGGCTGKVLLSDDFRQVDDSWGVEADSDAVTVEDGKVKIKPVPDGLFKLVYNGQQFDDADHCVTIQSPSNIKDVKDTTVLAGLIFWAQDNSNFYALLVRPNGVAALSRLVKGKWSDPVPFHQFGGVKQGPGAKNMLRVTTSGSSIIAYVNDQKFAGVKGSPPDGGGMTGLYVQSEKSSRDTWKFFDLKVTEHAQ
jgi:hypothetical protein